MRLSLGKTITSKDGEVARLSSNSIDNMLSGKKLIASTKGKEISPRQYFAIVSDIESLFVNSTKVLTHPDYKNDVNMKATHRFVAPLYRDKIAFITVKEAIVEGKRIYNIELIETGELEGKIGEVISKLPREQQLASPNSNVEIFVN